MLDKLFAKKLIVEYQQFVCEVQYIERDIDVDFDGNHVFVGMRRAGKSYLLYQCVHHYIALGHNPDEILFFNFEDDRVANLEVTDLDTIKLAYEELYAHKPIFFLDEIQIVDGWEKFARRLVDTGYRVFVTGSNAKMLSSEIATTLGGRYYIKEVFPFSFAEYLKLEHMELKPNWQYTSCTDIIRNFEPYFNMGGLPEVITKDTIYKREWLSSLFNKIYFGDLIARYSIRNDKTMRMLIRKMAESIKQPLSYNRTASLISSAGLKTKQETVADYCQYLQETWLMFSIENFASKLQEKVSTRKYYFTDNGFISLFLSDVKTSLLENIVAIALRRKYKQELTYYNHNIEVDFYLCESQVAYQVSYSIREQETRQREVKALLSLNEYIPLSSAYIITYDEEETIETADMIINVVPVWKWLLINDTVHN
ncbi:MAG: ATP-binding protein [Bacteroidales bacterium]|nr:ATP-binding protein [Bacteroidales bacterium]